MGKARDLAWSVGRSLLPRTLIARGWALAACALLAGPVGAKLPMVGDLPPDKVGSSATGEHLRLSDYRGKIVIVSFWASWCGPCRKEIPVLARIQKAATRDQLIVFAVNFGESRQRFSQIVRVLQDQDLTLVSDEYGRYASEYGVKGIPFMIMIGRDGRIAAIHQGYNEDEIPTLVDEINKLLMEGSPEAAHASP